MGLTPEGERGQLILVGGVALALVFVALGVLLNSAAFTGAEAAREGASDAGTALSVRDDAVEGVGGSLFYANYEDYDGGRPAIRSSLQSGVDAWDAALANASAAHRTIAGVERTDTTPGYQVFQNTSRQFTPPSGSPADWSIASSVTDVRRFAIEADPSESNGSSAFQVRFGTGGDLLRIYQAGDGTVSLYWNTDDGVGECSLAEQSAVVQPTSGTVFVRDADGTLVSACPAFEPLHGPATSYTLTYENADTVTGRYAFVLDGTPSSDLSTSLSSDPPHSEPAVYSATVEVTYRTATMDYVARATVAPEDTPKGPVFGVNGA